jgi:Domain of unknown function (DUF6458)
MGIGVGLFLVAAGAILTYAVERDVSGIDIQTVGVILMIVGAVGLVLSLLFWSSVAPFRRGRGDGEVVYSERREYR